MLARNCVKNLLLVFIGLNFCSYTGTQRVDPQSVNFNSFNVSVPSIDGDSTYLVNVVARHNSSDVTSRTSDRPIVQISGRRSNIVYDVTVSGLALDGSIVSNISTQTRTAPNGCEILQTITTPTFISVFLEDVPGATGWEVEYRNTETNESRILLVPDNTTSMTYFVGILSKLNPNTEYEMRARISQTNFLSDYSSVQSPFGSPIIVCTDRLSVFAQVQFLERDFVARDLNNLSFVDQLQNELNTAYTQTYSNVFNVTIILPNLLPGSSTLYVEILLDDRSPPPDVDSLISPNSILYNTTNSPFDVGASPGFAFASNGENSLLVYGTGNELETCFSGTINELRPNAVKTWSLFNDGQEIVSVELPELETLNSNQGLVFSDQMLTTDNALNPAIIFNFTSNTIYAIKPNYLIYGCRSSDTNALLYNRLYENSAVTSNSDKYTIVYTTNLTDIPVQFITDEARPDGVSVTLLIPSNLIRRLVSYQVVFEGEVVAELKEEEVDSSSSYSIVVDGLSRDQENNISITAVAREHNNETTVTTSLLTVVTATSTTTHETDTTIVITTTRSTETTSSIPAIDTSTTNNASQNDDTSTDRVIPSTLFNNQTAFITEQSTISEVVEVSAASYSWIAGLVVGILIFLVLVIILCLYYRRKYGKYDLDASRLAFYGEKTEKDHRNNSVHHDNFSFESTQFSSNQASQPNNQSQTATLDSEQAVIESDVDSIDEVPQIAV